MRERVWFFVNQSVNINILLERVAAKFQSFMFTTHTLSLSFTNANAQTITFCRKLQIQFHQILNFRIGRATQVANYIIIHSLLRKLPTQVVACDSQTKNITRIGAVSSGGTHMGKKKNITSREHFKSYGNKILTGPNKLF